MPFRIKPDESAQSAVRRIVCEQIDAMQKDLQDGDPRRAVHEVRKRCKKVRGLIRLVRPAMGKQYRAANATIRDAARTLAAARESVTLVQCFDELCERHCDVSLAARLRNTLPAAAPQSAHNEQDDLSHLLTQFGTRMLEIRDAALQWRIKGKRADPFLEGLELSYARARKDLRAAMIAETPEALHEWRKYVKYHWYHIRLLRGIWPAMMNARSRELSRLGELLGRDHDLAVLAGVLDRKSSDFTTSDGIEHVRELIGSDRRKLQAGAMPLGQVLFAEKPAEFTRRIRRYWRAFALVGGARTQCSPA